MQTRTYYVYILSSLSRCLYTGVTNDLLRRVWQHRTAAFGRAYTARYNVTRLVYFETTTDVNSAIAREKQIKSWRREKRVALIESGNAGRLDLAAGWFANERSPNDSRAPRTPRREGR